MKIIIPMTGYGSRFVAAGYSELKPLIKVQGKPILKWIVDGMYKGEKDFLFVVRKEHIDTIKDFEKSLKEIAPTATIAQIDDWVKKGPVYDVLRASDYIDDDEPCIINYCDFYMTWDYDKFCKDVKVRGCEGCIPCYTGFHPHLLIQDNVYASCKTDDNNDLIEIKEKYSFEQDKTKANHSPGTYYFKTGAIMKEYCQRLVDEDVSINGEFYASLPYNNMVKDELKVWIPTNVEQFCQWGTPQDLEEYLFYTEKIKEHKYD